MGKRNRYKMRLRSWRRSSFALPFWRIGDWLGRGRRQPNRE